MWTIFIMYTPAVKGEGNVFVVPAVGPGWLMELGLLPPEQRGKGLVAVESEE